jgi:iron-sulfur cluster assembly accessory protein
MITVSTTAAQEVKRMQKSRQKLDSHLRLKVEKGGCSGLFYKLELDQKVTEGDRTFTSNDITIVVNPECYSYVFGLRIDYSEDLMGGSFRFDNPNAVKHCSCGQSFSWQNS